MTILLSVILVILLAAMMFFHRTSWISDMEEVKLSETSEEITREYCGPYHIYAFQITDEGYTNESSLFSLREDQKSLALIEMNLVSYNDGAISEAGLTYIASLFSELADSGKQLIVRFLYDWDGEAWKYEPGDLSVILDHIDSLRDILHEYEQYIMILQGMFIGNWGEMNGTRFTGALNLQKIAEHLLAATGENTFLAVRTPAQRRTLKQSGVDISRIGLYNDGLLGSESDLGTYGTNDGKKMAEAWTRDLELAYQDEVARSVPNGGEAVGTSQYSDFENALEEMKTIHISYLNAGYDPDTLEKWQNTIVKEGSVFDGMNAYDYMMRHIGYRYVFTKGTIKENRLHSQLIIEAALKNEGFAPCYKSLSAYAVFTSGSGECFEFPLEGDFSELTYGDESVNLSAEIELAGLNRDDYTVSLFIRDEEGNTIETGNHLVNGRLEFAKITAKQ